MFLNEEQCRSIQTKVDGIFMTVDKKAEPLEPKQFVETFSMLTSRLNKLVDEEGGGLAFEPDAVKNIPSALAAKTPSVYGNKARLKAAFRKALRELDEDFFGEFLTEFQPNAEFHLNAPGEKPAGEDGEKEDKPEDSNEDVDGNDEAQIEEDQADGAGNTLTTLGLKIVDQLEAYGNQIVPEFNARGAGEYRFRATYYQEISAGGKPVISDFRLTVVDEDGKMVKKTQDLRDDGADFLALAVLSDLTLNPSNWDDNARTYTWSFVLSYYLKRTPTCWSVGFDNLKLLI